MKTTVHIADPLFDEAQKLAAEENTTLKELINVGLAMAVSDRKSRKQRQPFVLRDASFGGKGLHPDAQGKSWNDMLDLIYGGR